MPLGGAPNPFKRKTPGPETIDSGLADGVAKVVSDLTAIYGADETNTALERIVGSGPVDLEENKTSLPPASNDLLKWIEPIGKQYGQEKMLQALRARHRGDGFSSVDKP